MIIGVPREIMDHEQRVGAIPATVALLTRAGHTVLVQSGAGAGAGFSDEAYHAAGAHLMAHESSVWEQADLVVKVKQPLPPEYAFLRPGLALFCYLHLAAEPELTELLVERGVTAIAYETVQMPDGALPLLSPMSEIAGRLSAQVAAHYLEAPAGGMGKLIGGAAGVAPARVIIVGGGVVGLWAAHVALGMGAAVTVADVNGDRLRYLQATLGGRFSTIYSNGAALADALDGADVLIGGVLVPGAKAPKVVSKAMVGTMARGGIAIDVAIDQGGCIETARLTTHTDPVYDVGGVLHYCVGNIPAAVPRTSTLALVNAAFPWVERLAGQGVSKALNTDLALAHGANVVAGAVTYRRVADSVGLPWTDVTIAVRQLQTSAAGRA